MWLILCSKLHYSLLGRIVLHLKLPYETRLYSLLRRIMADLCWASTVLVEGAQPIS